MRWVHSRFVRGVGLRGWVDAESRGYDDRYMDAPSTSMVYADWMMVDEGVRAAHAFLCCALIINNHHSQHTHTQRQPLFVCDGVVSE